MCCQIVQVAESGFLVNAYDECMFVRGKLLGDKSLATQIGPAKGSKKSQG